MDAKLHSFLEFHNKNPHIWVHFVKKVLKKISSGASKLKGHDIIREIRNNKKIVTTTMRDPGGKKIDNNHIAFYVRFFQKEYPEHADVFQTRKLKES